MGSVFKEIGELPERSEPSLNETQKKEVKQIVKKYTKTSRRKQKYNKSKKKG